jgi:NDP-sugar pyrophosphorylase family protein
MKAMILAAGLGTRLRPLTDKKPKALMPVVNKPIIGWVIEYLKKHGIDQIVVNAHHHYRQIVDYLDGGRPFGLEIDVRVEPEILGTGGGIKNTEDFWGDDPFIVINSDILTNINLSRAYESHKKLGGRVTLILHDCTPYNQIQIDDNGFVTDISAWSAQGRFAFTGIHIMDPDLLTHIPDRVFSDIIDCYRKLIQSGRSIRSLLTTGHYWRDMGTVENYMQANRDLLDKESFSVGPDCHIDDSTKFEDWAVIGEKTTLEEDVEIRRSILWDEVRVRKGVKVIDSVVTSFRTVDRNLIKETY